MNNNLAISLKKFFTNKNTVTIIGVVAILIILYFMYTKTIESQTDKKLVPVAAKEIPAETEITADMITNIQIASAAMPQKVEKNVNNIKGKYTCQNSMIPEGSMFYSDALCSFDDLPGSWIKALQPDENGVMPIPYSFPVNVASTYGNSIQPGDYVDFWAKTILENSTQKGANGLIYSKVFENAKVLSVTDSSGKNVFQSKNSTGTPAYLNFGLSPDHYKFFRYMENVEEQAITIIVVPHGGTVETEGSAVVSASQFRELVRGFTSTYYNENDKPEVLTTTSNTTTPAA